MKNIIMMVQWAKEEDLPQLKNLMKEERALVQTKRVNGVTLYAWMYHPDDEEDEQIIFVSDVTSKIEPKG